MPAMMISGALFSVALSSPPTVSPKLWESASVALPISSASGMIDSADAAKTRIALKPNQSSTTATGMKKSSQFKLTGLLRHRPDLLDGGSVPLHIPTQHGIGPSARRLGPFNQATHCRVVSRNAAGHE